MAKSSRPREIDGLSSVKAAGRSSKKKSAPRVQPSRTRLQGGKPETAADSPPAKRIGHTVVPDKFSITCYECEYVFSITGKLKDTFCPKCKTELKADNVSVSSPVPRSVKTIGTTTISGSTDLKTAAVITRDMVLSAAISGGSVIVRNRLFLDEGATFDPNSLKALDITVKPAADIKIHGELSCRNILIEGIIDADLKITGTATVTQGGWLKGTITGEHLILKEGGGLSAQIDLK